MNRASSAETTLSGKLPRPSASDSAQFLSESLDANAGESQPRVTCAQLSPRLRQAYERRLACGLGATWPSLLDVVGSLRCNERPPWGSFVLPKCSKSATADHIAFQSAYRNLLASPMLGLCMCARSPFLYAAMFSQERGTPAVSFGFSFPDIKGTPKGEW